MIRAVYLIYETNRSRIINIFQHFSFNLSLIFIHSTAHTIYYLLAIIHLLSNPDPPIVIQSLPPCWPGSSWRRDVQSGTVSLLFLPSPESSSSPDLHSSLASICTALRATTGTTSRGLLLRLQVNNRSNHSRAISQEEVWCLLFSCFVVLSVLTRSGLPLKPGEFNAIQLCLWYIRFSWKIQSWFFSGGPVGVLKYCSSSPRESEWVLTSFLDSTLLRNLVLVAWISS